MTFWSLLPKGISNGYQHFGVAIPLGVGDFRLANREPIGTGRLSVIRATPTCNGLTGEFQIDEYSGDNSLFNQGTLQVSTNHRYFETADGTPFLWLGDTWWLGLTERLSWPADFKQLVSDRRDKGFNVVQLVAGLYPDMDSFDPRGKNEAGFPWEANYQRINPSWWDLADQRIGDMVDSELMPCILGCWGYYLKKLALHQN